MASDNKQHNNLAKLDAAIKGLDLALQRQIMRLHIKTDSLSVYHRLFDALMGIARVRTKADAGAMKVGYNEGTDPRIQVVSRSVDNRVKPELGRQDDQRTPNVARYRQKCG